jgi:hypothetical protein
MVNHKSLTAMILLATILAGTAVLTILLGAQFITDLRAEVSREITPDNIAPPNRPLYIKSKGGFRMPLIHNIKTK